MSLRNPIIPGFNPDPSICRVGDDYFIATSTFEYFPGVPIYTSKNLVDWRLIGHALSRPSQLFLRSCQPAMGVFAPTLRYHKGRYYMTTCAVHNRGAPPDGFYVWTDDIFKPDSWSEPIYFDLLGIDQDLFFDGDRAYLSVGKPYSGPDPDMRGIMLSCYTVEVDMATGSSLGEAVLTRFSRLSGVGAEGPHIIRRGEFLYLISAEGGTETSHQEWVSRSKHPLGPWEVHPGPILYNADHDEVRQTGHMDMVEGTDGRWWAVFLAVRPVPSADGFDLSQLGRETFLAPVEWVDDWPVINGGNPVTLQADYGLPRLPERFTSTFTFDPETNLYAEGWYRLRTPVRTDYSLTQRPGSLALRGGPYKLEHQEAVTMFLQKQTSFIGTWRVTLDYAPQPGHEAGTAMWFSKYAYASLGVRGTDTGRELVLRVPNFDDMTFKETMTALDDAPVEFRVEATHSTFAFHANGRHIANVETKLFHRKRPFDSVMTGTHMIVYAVGDKHQASLNWAYFSQASWEGVRDGGE